MCPWKGLASSGGRDRPNLRLRGADTNRGEREPGSESQEALNLLASWTATVDHAKTAHATDGA
jgi:hypothetical protein